MIVELAIATQTAPRDWWDEPIEVILTGQAVLARMATRARSK